MNNLRVTYKHIYATKVSGRTLCATGARKWFECRDLSWSEFVENGILAADLSKVNDVFSKAVIETALREKYEVQYGK